MKTMTCNQLAGACDKKFTAETFEEISEMSKAHGMEMFEKGDAAHLEAMNEMKKNMTSPDAYQTWLKSMQNLFERLPEE